MDCQGIFGHNEQVKIPPESKRDSKWKVRERYRLKEGSKGKNSVFSLKMFYVNNTS